MWNVSIIINQKEEDEMITEKQIDDKRLEIVENLMLLEKLKRQMHIDVYRAAIKAYAKILSEDNVYVDVDLELVRPEFRESLSDYMIQVCGFNEIQVSNITKIKVALNNLIDQTLSSEDFYDNHKLFTTLGGIVRKLGPKPTKK